MMRRFTRRLQSVSKAAQQFWDGANRQPAAVKLGVEGCEDRVVPAVTATFDGTTLLITNDADGVADTIALAQVGDNITVFSVADAAFIGPGGVAGDAGVKAIKIVNNEPAAPFTTFATTNLQTTTLKTLSYQGNVNQDVLDLGGILGFTAVTNTNLFVQADLGGTAAGVLRDKFTAPAAGTVVLGFETKAANPAGSGLDVDTSVATADTFIAFNFKAVTTSVQANLNVSAGGQIANFAGANVNLTAGTNTSLIGVYGGKGNDSLIGNDQGNILIGFEGNDTLVGNGGADQLNATRDFSPAIAKVNADVIDLTNFTTAKSQVSTNNQASVASGTLSQVGANAFTNLFNQFGRFNFGEGQSFANSNFTTVDFNADFQAAEAEAGVQSDDFLFGGAGDDGLYGFNGARITAFGEAGNDVSSANSKSRAGSLDGGTESDFLVGAFGAILIGGDGDDTLSVAISAADQANPTLGSPTRFVGGLGNDKISAGLSNTTVDASEGTDTVSIGNFATNVLIFNATTVFDAGSPLAGLTLTQKVQK